MGKDYYSKKGCKGTMASYDSFLIEVLDCACVEKSCKINTPYRMKDDIIEENLNKQGMELDNMDPILIKDLYAVLFTLSL
ncbi:MAG TPA: hypothetical protein VLN47_09030, partial [Clostridiaceae bacterium]|nr:hypothetical protein [Clostridiaceae bacterium]